MCFSKDLSRYKDVAHLLLRVVIAAIFLYHGTQKLGFWTQVPPGMPPIMVSVMKVLSVVEPLAGVAMLLGLFTQAAAATLAVVMLGAIWVKSSGLQGPFSKWEFELLILAANIALLIEGADAYSLDRRMKK